MHVEEDSGGEDTAGVVGAGTKAEVLLLLRRQTIADETKRRPAQRLILPLDDGIFGHVLILIRENGLANLFQ